MSLIRRTLKGGSDWYFDAPKQTNELGLATEASFCENRFVLRSYRVLRQT